RADAEVFLACDMPLIAPDLLRGLLAGLGRRHGAVFAVSRGRVGFPFVVKSALWPIVEGRLAAGQLGLPGVARALRSRLWVVPARWRKQLRNINTPEEWARVRWETRPSPAL